MTTPESGAQIRQRLTLDRLAELREAATASPARFEQRTLSLLEQMVVHARENVPFYRYALESAPRPGECGSTQGLLDRLPVVSRSDVQEHLDAMRYRRPGDPPEAYDENFTSGSTGRPVAVLKHGPSYAVDYDATTLLDWEWHRRPLDASVVMYRVIDHEGDGPIGPPMSYVGHTGTAHWRSIAHHTPEQMVDLLHRVAPETVFCNGVVLRQLCIEQMSSARPPLAIGRFVTVSDRIDRALRDLAHEAFGAVVEDRYSTEEVGYVALQCPDHEHMHTMGDSLLVEVVDEQGRPCRPGELGRVLVTTLRAWAQPLIRYEIGDRAMWGASCASGIVWPVVDLIEGRLRDGVELPDGTFHMVTLFESALVTSRDVRDYVCALFDNAIVVMVDTPTEPHHDLVRRISADVSEAFSLRRPVVVRRIEPGQRLRPWKRREWYRGIGRYTESMSAEQVWAALKH